VIVPDVREAVFQKDVRSVPGVVKERSRRAGRVVRGDGAVL
jgi:hypothetical protein